MMPKIKVMLVILLYFIWYCLNMSHFLLKQYNSSAAFTTIVKPCDVLFVEGM